MDGKAEIVGWKRLLEVFFVLFISGGVLWLSLVSYPRFSPSHYFFFLPCVVSFDLSLTFKGVTVFSLAFLYPLCSPSRWLPLLYCAFRFLFCHFLQ